MTTVRIELSDERRGNLMAMANRIRDVNSLVEVAAWSNRIEPTFAGGRLVVDVSHAERLVQSGTAGFIQFVDHLKLMHEAEIDADRLLVTEISYHSPLLIAITGTVTTSPSIRYAILRLYNKCNDVSKDAIDLK